MSRRFLGAPTLALALVLAGCSAGRGGAPVVQTWLGADWHGNRVEYRECGFSVEIVVHMSDEHVDVGSMRFTGTLDLPRNVVAITDANGRLRYEVRVLRDGADRVLDVWRWNWPRDPPMRLRPW
jgi:hypothetical protein